MALHVTTTKIPWQDQGLTNTTSCNGMDVSACIEGRLFFEVDVTTGTWTPKVEQQNPKTSTWFTRSDISFSTFTTTGGPNSDGQNQTQTVALTNFGSRIRVTMTPSGAPSPIATITLVFEGKS